MGVVGTNEKELPQPVQVDAVTRAFQSPELGPPALDLPFDGLVAVADPDDGPDAASDPDDGEPTTPAAGAV